MFWAVSLLTLNLRTQSLTALLQNPVFGVSLNSVRQEIPIIQ